MILIKELPLTMLATCLLPRAEAAGLAAGHPGFSKEELHLWFVFWFDLMTSNGFVLSDDKAILGMMRWWLLCCEKGNRWRTSSLLRLESRPPTGNWELLEVHLVRTNVHQNVRLLCSLINFSTEIISTMALSSPLTWMNWKICSRGGKREVEKSSVLHCQVCWMMVMIIPMIL